MRRSGSRGNGLDVDCAERLLVPYGCQVSRGVEDQKLVEVLEVVVAVPGGPDEQVGARRGASYYKISIASVVRQEVEPYEFVRARCDAAVLHIVVSDRTVCVATASSTVAGRPAACPASGKCDGGTDSVQPEC